VDNTLSRAYGIVVHPEVVAEIQPVQIDDVIRRASQMQAMARAQAEHRFTHGRGNIKRENGKKSSVRNRQQRTR